MSEKKKYVPTINTELMAKIKEGGFEDQQTDKGTVRKITVNTNKIFLEHIKAKGFDNEMIRELNNTVIDYVHTLDQVAYDTLIEAVEKGDDIEKVQVVDTRNVYGNIATTVSLAATTPKRGVDENKKFCVLKDSEGNVITETVYGKAVHTVSVKVPSVRDMFASSISRLEQLKASSAVVVADEE